MKISNDLPIDELIRSQNEKASKYIEGRILELLSSCAVTIP